MNIPDMVATVLRAQNDVFGRGHYTHVRIHPAALRAFLHGIPQYTYDGTATTASLMGLGVIQDDMMPEDEVEMVRRIPITVRAVAS